MRLCSGVPSRASYPGRRVGSYMRGTLRPTYIPRSRTLHGVLIDDRLSLSIIAGGAEGQGTAARATQEWDAAMDAYACSCGRPVEAKAQRRARKGRVWGARLDGRRGKLGGPPERRAALGVVSLRLARCGYSSPRLLEQLLGTYVFHLIFRRAAFSVPSSAFRFARGGNSPTLVQRLPADVRSEMVCLALLGPLIETDLRAQVSPRLWCTDASPTAAAAVHADLPAAAARELWRHRDSRSSYVRLSSKQETADGLHAVDSPEACSLMESVVQAIIDKDPNPAALAEEFRLLDLRGATQCNYTEPFAPPSRDA